METILYIASDALTLMKGYKKKNKYFVMDTKRYPFQGEGIASLEDIDQEKLNNILKQINAESLCLLLSTKFVQWKIAEIPNLKSEYMIRKLVEQEMDEIVTSDKKFVYDYRMLKIQDANGLRIMMFAVQEDVVNYAIQMSKKYRLKLTRIDIVMNSIIKIFEDFFSQSYQSVGLLVAEGKEVNTYLFIDGKFRYFGKNQIRSEMNSESYANEIVNYISQLIQFKRANYRDAEFNKFYFAGVEADNFYKVSNVLKSLFQIEVGSYDEFHMLDGKGKDIPVEQWLYQLGSLGEWK